MAIFRINKSKDYTTMSNYHLRDMNLSLKAKGMLSLMLSLPDNWDFSVRGLEQICKEAKNTINDILRELEDNNYLVRKRIYTNGKISDWEYNIYERNDLLHRKNQDIENQDIENCDINKYTKELNTKEYKEINNNKLLFTKKSDKFVKPTLEQVEEYCKERNNNINAQTFIDYYESVGWKVGKSSMKDWKACVRTWENKEKQKSKHLSATEKFELEYQEFIKNYKEE